MHHTGEDAKDAAYSHDAGRRWAWFRRVNADEHVAWTCSREPCSSNRNLSNLTCLRRPFLSGVALIAEERARTRPESTHMLPGYLERMDDQLPVIDDTGK